MSEWAPKRFWTSTDTTSVDGGFGVVLDGRPVRTPAKALLSVPTEALAQRIAAEFDAQTDIIDPNTMPFTRTANSAVDKVMVQHGAVADMLAEYGDSDLLCYRAGEPNGLVSRQSAQWDPLLDWAAETLGARLEPRTGVMHVAQSQDALDKLRAQVHAMTAFELAAFHDLVSLSGSLIIGFAAKLDVQAPEALWDISRVDEIWQQEQWGVDEDAREMAEIKRNAFLHAHEFTGLIAAHSRA